jgi:hypothetical protein
MQPDDDALNNAVAAGALYALLHSCASRGEVADVELTDGQAGNRLDLWLAFLRSPYRLTIERVVDAALPEDDRWFTSHDHQGFGRHAHHVKSGHPGNWPGRDHANVRVVTWAELQAQP